jgi:hypothetical protein
MRQRNHLRVLPDAQTGGEFFARRLQSTFVNTTSALGCRPEPRHRFDNAARQWDDPSRAEPWADVLEPLRDAASVAATRGGACADETESRIIEFVLVLLEAALLPLRETAGEPVTYDVAAREVPDAIDWMARARMLPTPENVARAEREIAEGVCALQLHRTSLRVGEFRRPMGVPMGVV